MSAQIRGVALGDLGQRGVVEHHVGGHAVGGGALASPFLRRSKWERPSPSTVTGLRFAVLASTGHVEWTAGGTTPISCRNGLGAVRGSWATTGKVRASACDAHVQQAAFLAGVGCRALRAEGELLVEQSRQEHRVELQTLRAVVREQVHASARLLGREATASSSSRNPATSPVAPAAPWYSAANVRRRARSAWRVTSSVSSLPDVGVEADLVGGRVRPPPRRRDRSRWPGASRAITARGPGRRRKAPSRTW